MISWDKNYFFISFDKWTNNAFWTVFFYYVSV